MMLMIFALLAGIALFFSGAIMKRNYHRGGALKPERYTKNPSLENAEKSVSGIHTISNEIPRIAATVCVFGGVILILISVSSLALMVLG